MLQKDINKVRLLKIICLGISVVVIASLLGACGNITSPSSNQITPSQGEVTAATVTVGPTSPTTSSKVSPEPASTPQSINSPGQSATTSNPITTNPPTAVKPTTVAAVKVADFPPAPSSAIKLSKNLADLQLELEITPGKIGNNSFIARLSRDEGEAVTNVRLVKVSATMLDMDMGTDKVELKPFGSDAPGLYRGQGYLMSMYGKYRIDLLVQQPGQPDALATFEASVTSSK